VGTPLSANDLGLRLARRSAAIKTVLLNQSVVAGIGNIYADEILFRTRIHPKRPANSLTPRELRRLSATIPEILSEAIESRGTTFSTYQDVNGQAGGNQGRLKVFHRQDLPCYVCGASICRIVLASRGTHFCPKCQPAKSIP